MARAEAARVVEGRVLAATVRLGLGVVGPPQPTAKTVVLAVAGRAGPGAAAAGGAGLPPEVAPPSWSSQSVHALRKGQQAKCWELLNTL